MVALALAIPTGLITIIRLWVRARSRNLGLDDAFAAASLVGLVVNCVATFLHFDPHRTPPPSLGLLSCLNRFIFLPVLAQYSFKTKYMIYYIFAETFYWVIWYPFSSSHTCSFPHTQVQVRPPLPPVYNHSNYSPFKYRHTAHLAGLCLDLWRCVVYS